MRNIFVTNIAVGLLLVGCATTQTTMPGAVGVERKQFMMLSEKQVEKMSAQSYIQTLRQASEKKKLNPDPMQLQRVRNIANWLIPQTSVYREDAVNWKWEVNVQDSKEINAYCMPGGKIMVYTGLINKLKLTDDELAAVMGHEIAHALREHGRERMSIAYAQRAGVMGLGILAAIFSDNPKTAKTTMQAASTISNLALTLPNSREGELEADRIGLELSARAGYDPNAAVSLWRKMGAQNSKKPPEWMSTHPSDQSRINDLQRLIPSLMPLYEEAKKRRTS